MTSRLAGRLGGQTNWRKDFGPVEEVRMVLLVVGVSVVVGRSALTNLDAG